MINRYVLIYVILAPDTENPAKLFVLNTNKKHAEIVIVRSGFSGIGGLLSFPGLVFMILETGNDLGDIWRPDTYPELAVDV